MAPEPSARLPVLSPLPALPSASFWSEAQWDVLLALIEAAYPPIAAAATGDVPLPSEGGGEGEGEGEGNPGTRMRISSGLWESSYRRICETAQGNAPLSREAFGEFLSHSPARARPCLEALVRTMAALLPRRRRRFGLVLRLLSCVPALFVLGRWGLPPMTDIRDAGLGWEVWSLPDIGHHSTPSQST